MHPAGPATGRLDTGSWFDLSLEANAEMGPKFPVATACFSCSPINLSSRKLSPFVYKGTKLISRLPNSTLIKKIKAPWPMFQVTASNHCNLFTFILVLTEGQAGKAWEPSNESHISRPSHKKSVSHFSHDFSLPCTFLLYFLNLCLRIEG
jgi:hypothetical protein